MTLALPQGIFFDKRSQSSTSRIPRGSADVNRHDRDCLVCWNADQKTALMQIAQTDGLVDDWVA